MTKPSNRACITTRGFLAITVSLTSICLPLAALAQENGKDPTLHNSSLPLPYLHFSGDNLTAGTDGTKANPDAFKDVDFASPFLSAKRSLSAREIKSEAQDENKVADAREGQEVAQEAPTTVSPFPSTFEKGKPLALPESQEKSGDMPTETAFIEGIGGSGILDNAPIIIDNDEKKEVEEKVDYENLPTDQGKTKIKAGARFPVVVTTQITSKTAKQGDAFQARLKYDLKIGDRLIAKKGALVNGHVNYVLKARTPMASLVSPERWYRNSGTLGITFDEIVNESHEHIPLHAQPARMARIVKNKAQGRELGVNHKGQITGPWSQQLRYKALRIGLNAALAPAGVFSFGAMPVALGVIGAANPSFAFMKPVGQNVRHRRIKGFAWGFLSGVPGSWLVEDTIIKGQEAVIEPGDEFLIEFNQEFTGEASTDAELMPGASTKVHGQLLKVHKKKK